MTLLFGVVTKDSTLKLCVLVCCIFGITCSSNQLFRLQVLTEPFNIFQVPLRQKSLVRAIISVILIPLPAASLLLGQFSSQHTQNVSSKDRKELPTVERATGGHVKILRGGVRRDDPILGRSNSIPRCWLLARWRLDGQGAV